MSKDSELLTSVSKTSTDSEFFSPIPPGYKPGRTKYLFVMGTVMSGLAKVKHTCDGIDTPEQYAEFVKRYKNSHREHRG